MTRADVRRRGIGMTSQRTRERLLQQLRAEGIRNERVLAVLRDVPRHLFIDEALASRAYENTALPIGFGQTISQPYIVARMTEALLENAKPKRVLEIGTGSGYQTAVLASLVEEVYTVERLEPLMKLARKRLREMGYRNVQAKLAAVGIGWPQHAPYDGILVTAAPQELPPALLEQLAPGGCLIAPVGGPAMQELRLVRRTDTGFEHEHLGLANFVPLILDN
ncbi:MAG: protein-L-isoaspartate(D-aspartate) O-methyltransferase [Gammaproteobacteria bacterium]|nr:MAG: protein-L-isoaspartate(D-aspartate) O-methyltransferase [Gammaproteobacteria bacterium]